MSLMKKTEHGTVFATTFDEKDSLGTHIGMLVGIYNKHHVLTVECFNGELVVMLNDDAIEDLGIKVVHTDAKWNVKE